MQCLHGKQRYILTFLALLGALFLFVGGPGPDSLRSFRYVWGVGHLFCFALWAYLYVTWRSDQPFKRHLFEVVLLAFLFGGLTELIQSGIGREATWQDLGNDLVGALLGVVFFAESRKTVCNWQLKLLQAPVLFMALWSLLPVGKVMIDDVTAWRQFPLLSGFEMALEETRWGGSARRDINHDVHFAGSSSLRIRLTTQRYSGVGLKDFPQNWTDYRSVSLQVFNPDQDPLQLHFRIHDQLHRKYSNAYGDRFNTSFMIKKGWNQLQVSLAEVAQAPKNRTLDLTRIAGMGVFVGKLDRSRMIYLDDVKLLP
ncbi:MAG: VanZ family protein [Desulfuromusa sp.]|nr:VanZ family protein [Desulfuromusa sp.]